MCNCNVFFGLHTQTQINTRSFVMRSEHNAFWLASHPTQSCSKHTQSDRLPHKYVMPKLYFILCQIKYIWIDFRLFGIHTLMWLTYLAVKSVGSGGRATLYHHHHFYRGPIVSMCDESEKKEREGGGKWDGNIGQNGARNFAYQNNNNRKTKKNTTTKKQQQQQQQQ